MLYVNIAISEWKVTLNPSKIVWSKNLRTHLLVNLKDLSWIMMLIICSLSTCNPQDRWFWRKALILIQQLPQPTPIHISRWYCYGIVLCRYHHIVQDVYLIRPIRCCQYHCQGRGLGNFWSDQCACTFWVEVCPIRSFRKIYLRSMNKMPRISIV